MGKIELNLRTRAKDVDRYNYKSNSKAAMKRIGIKTARKLASMLKQAKLCPTVERISFSKVVITY